MTQFGLDGLFNPGKRHQDEERQRLESTREEVGDSSGGRRVDLESGKVTIRLTGRTEPPAEPASADQTDQTDRGDQTDQADHNDQAGT